MMPPPMTDAEKVEFVGRWLETNTLETQAIRTLFIALLRLIDAKDAQLIDAIFNTPFEKDGEFGAKMFEHIQLLQLQVRPAQATNDA